MTAQDVWRALWSGPPSTVAELAGRLGEDPSIIRKRVAYLRQQGRVVSTGRGVKGSPLVYRATGRPQTHAAGLTDALLKILSNHGDLGRFAAASGLPDATVLRTLNESLLDEPDAARHLSRSVASATACKLAQQLEDQAARLRAWAAQCTAARRGEPTPVDRPEVEA